VVAEEMPGAFTVDELSIAARAHGASAGTATVYRAVAAMEASGWLERVGERNGSALFARCGAGGHHHHHVICDGCGRVAATDCPVAEQVASSAQSDGFVITRHEVTLYGLCSQCARSAEDGR
jgi:Fe2+ or Zn2+ uptake regulation protein